MEKKDLLGVRKKTAAAAGKRRRKVVAPAKASAGRFAKAIADYLAFDSYMYAPLVSDPPPPPTAATSAPPAAAAPSAASPPETEAALVQKYRSSWRATFIAC